MAKTPNHLAGQTSPYLIQHLYNPVDWYPWGKEALLRAKTENKPLLVSIGYSACHWCHVMERESFEDPEVAKLMNDNFVCIKVDREERPDVDHVYMDAVQLVAGHGGWPLNCFALPDGRPFWGGTYFPTDQWKSILQRIHELFHNQFDDLVQQAASVTEGIASAGFVTVTEEQAAFSRAEAKEFFVRLNGQMDKQEGGTMGAPKFPVPVTTSALLHYHHQTKEKPFIDQVNLTLRKMAMGGIYDQLGGGFARYATDEQWRIPHFEKMLYDNAQLLSLYAQAFLVNQDPLYRDVIMETIGFIDRELRSPDGLYYAALDADSDGEEGKYYVWKEHEVDMVLGQDSPLIKKYYRIGEKAFWERGKNILMREEGVAAFSRNQGLQAAHVAEVVNQSRKKLLQARQTRTSPGLDNKVLTGWNALMIEGLANAYASLGIEDYLHQATSAMHFLLKHVVTEEGRLFRKLNGTDADIHAFLEDYSLMIRSLIRLFEVSMEEAFVLKAKLLTEYVINHFSDDNTQLFLFSDNHDNTLSAKHFEVFDHVIPSSNSVMAHNLFRLANLFELPEWGNRSSSMMRDMRSRWERHSGSFANWGSLLLHHTSPFHTIAVVGPGAGKLIKEFLSHYLPDAVLAGTEKPDSSLPVFEKRYNPGETWIYVCSFGYCKQAVATVKEALRML
jgi:uncharacterized protein